MSTLFTYMKQVQRFLRDQSMVLINTNDLISYINRARREVAMRSQSIRIVPPISGSCTTISIVSGGSGYSTSPTVTISVPDFPEGTAASANGTQATAQAIVIGGVITQIDVTSGGTGYFQPTVTITDTTGHGASATVAVSPMWTANAGQEIYRFADIPLNNFPGVDSVFAVNSVSIIFANCRFSLPQYAFSVYQAKIRNYPRQYQYVPSICTQFGQGVAGSLYLYPLPSTTYQMEWDCFCLPSDLRTDQSYEALPAPWTETVPYFAAHLAFLELQNFNAAAGYMKMYDEMVHRYSGYSRPGRVTNPYGRY